MYERNEKDPWQKPGVFFIALGIGPATLMIALAECGKCDDRESILNTKIAFTFDRDGNKEKPPCMWGLSFSTWAPERSGQQAPLVSESIVDEFSPRVALACAQRVGSLGQSHRPDDFFSVDRAHDYITSGFHQNSRINSIPRGVPSRHHEFPDVLGPGDFVGVAVKAQIPCVVREHLGAVQNEGKIGQFSVHCLSRLHGAA